MVVMSLTTCVISLELSPSLRTVSDAPLLVSTAVCATFEAWAELPVACESFSLKRASNACAHESITDYPLQELVALVRWIQSD